MDVDHSQLDGVTTAAKRIDAVRSPKRTAGDYGLAQCSLRRGFSVHAAGPCRPVVDTTISAAIKALYKRYAANVVAENLSGRGQRRRHSNQRLKITAPSHGRDISHEGDAEHDDKSASVRRSLIQPAFDRVAA
jgi:hypothetical protein